VVDYETPKYSIRDGAHGSGFALNTLRSLYGRGHFRIVGGEAKKGRGLAAELTLADIMCIAVAKVAIDAGVHPRVSFEAGMKFAYSSGGAAGPNTGARLPSQLFSSGSTVLVCHPATGASKIINAVDGLSFADLFQEAGALCSHAAVAILLDDVQSAVFRALALEGRAN